MDKINNLLVLFSLSGSILFADDFISSVQQAPEVKAALHRLDAARVRAGAAGRWADPQLEGMYSTKDMPEGSWPMWEVNLTQPLPKYGERSADRAKSRASMNMAKAEMQMMAGNVASEVAMALAERDAAAQRVDLLRQQADRTERALAALEIRVGSGQGKMKESLALQNRLTSLRLEMEKESFMAGESERVTRQLLGMDSNAPLPLFAAPMPGDIAIDKSPELALLEAQQDEARAMKDMARADGKPMTSVGVRFEREEADTGDEDTIGVAFMTDLPWHSRRYSRADVSAALADLEGRAVEIDALKRRFEAERVRAERLLLLADQTRETTSSNQERLDREYDAWIETSGTTGMMESSTVLMIIEILERGTELRMLSINAEAEAQVARAALWRYTTIVTGDEYD